MHMCVGMVRCAHASETSSYMELDIYTNNKRKNLRNNGWIDVFYDAACMYIYKNPGQHLPASL